MVVAHLKTPEGEVCMYEQNGTNGKPEYIRFQANVPERISGLKYSQGRKVTGMSGEQMMYTATDGRRFYLDLDVAARIERMGIQVATPFWILKRKPAGRGAFTSWEVYLDDPTPAPGESRLERDLRLSASPAYVNAHKLAAERSVHGELAVPKLDPGAATSKQEQLSRPALNGSDSPQGSIPDFGSPINTPQIERKPAQAASTAAAPAQLPPRPKTQLEDALCTAVQACYFAQGYARELGYGLTFDSEQVAKIAMTVLIGKQQERGKAA